MCKKARVTERVNVSFVSHVDVNSTFEVMDQGDKKFERTNIFFLGIVALIIVEI